MRASELQGVTMKLGCNLTPKEQLRYVPLLSNYLKLPLIADSCDYQKRWVEAWGTPDWGMLGNDQVGDCVVAAKNHVLQAQAINATGVKLGFTAEETIAEYSRLGGYNPSDPSTDQGLVPLDALRAWLNDGTIIAFGRVDPTDDVHVAAAIELFGSLYSGWDLPIAWRHADVWGAGPDLTGIWTPGSWGGHMTNQVGYDSLLGMQTITWGTCIRTTRAARYHYCSEAYALITQEWLDSTGRTIQGFDIDGLRQRLTLLR